MALSAKERDNLLSILKDRFEQNMGRHKGLDWAKVQARLEANPEKLLSLHEMEKTDGLSRMWSDTIRKRANTFLDCSPESPKDVETLRP